MRPSFRYSVLRSMPRTCGARLLFPPVAASTRRICSDSASARMVARLHGRQGVAYGLSIDARGRILAAAMDLFRTRGFESTTMREIAQELVMAFYEQSRDDMRPVIVQALSEERDLQGALRAILDAKLRYFAPNRKFLGALFGHAADPENPLSPFSEETREIRETDIGHFEQALERGGVKIPVDLKPHLPRLLWM